MKSGLTADHPFADPASPGLAPVYGIAAAILAALPLVMVVATRSGPAVMVLAAAVALAGAVWERGFSGLREEASAHWSNPLANAACAFFAWAALSILWSPFPGLSARVLGEFILPVLATIVLAVFLPGRVDIRFWTLVGAGCAAAAGALILIDLSTGLAARAHIGARAFPHVLNRSVLTLLILIPPLVLLLMRGRPRWLGGLVLLAVAGLAAARSVSGAAKFGLLAGLASLPVAARMREVMLGLLALALLGSLAVAPVLGDLADAIIPKSVTSRLADAHAQDRIDIWRSFAAAVREQPFLGAGFGTSARFGNTPVAARIVPEFRQMLDVGHPHNAPLQIWAELGVVGAALAALVVVLALREAERLDDARFASAGAIAGGALAASLVGQGAWQGWWPAAIGASLVWLRLAGTEKAG